MQSLCIRYNKIYHVKNVGNSAYLRMLKIVHTFTRRVQWSIELKNELIDVIINVGLWVLNYFLCIWDKSFKLRNKGNEKLTFP